MKKGGSLGLRGINSNVQPCDTNQSNYLYISSASSYRGISMFRWKHQSTGSMRTKKTKDRFYSDWNCLCCQRFQRLSQWDQRSVKSTFKKAPCHAKIIKIVVQHFSTDNKIQIDDDNAAAAAAGGGGGGGDEAPTWQNMMNVNVSKTPTWKYPSPCLDQKIEALVVIPMTPAMKLQHLRLPQGLERTNWTCRLTWVPWTWGLRWSPIQRVFLQLFGLGCGWCANSRVVHGHMSTKVGSCWFYWRKRVASIKPCSSQGRVNGQRVSESNLGKGFSLLLATFKMYQSNGLQHFEVWQSMRQCKDLTSGKSFETQFCVSPHFLQEDLLLKVYYSCCIWAMREGSCVHLPLEVFGCCRDLAQQLEPTLLSCAVTADVDELILRRWLPVRRPLHFPNAPSTVLVWGGVMD